MADSAIAARTGHSLKTVQQNLDIYMPRTVAAAGRGSVAMLELERERRATTEPREKTA